MKSTLNFAGFTSSWKTMQIFFTQVEKTPSDESSFICKYGEFAEASEIQPFIDACTEVLAVAKALGNPTSLKESIAKNPSYLSSSSAPDETYANIVWLAGLSSNAAQSIAHTYSDLQHVLSPSEGTIERRAENLKTAFLGNAGLVPITVKIKSEAVLLDKKITPMIKQLTDTFSSFGKTTLINQANQEIGALETSISKLKVKCEDAEKAWKDAWISKDKAKKRYEEILDELSSKKKSYALKTQFINDLEGFFVAGNDMLQASMDVSNNINAIGHLFGEQRDAYMNICRISSDEQLSDYAWVAKAFDLPSSVNQWNEIKTSAKSFIEKSLTSL
jgi:hypothetical protein